MKMPRQVKFVTYTGTGGKGTIKSLLAVATDKCIQTTHKNIAYTYIACEFYKTMKRKKNNAIIKTLV